ncbi:MAG TPA: potassium channel family protein, partial [Candidatus Limnocylindrales bacterium]|nr:potassium channel family protein [Candidatus Limnocylindrales bacterium]
MSPFGLVEMLLGVLLVAGALFDVFESVVVPRPSPTRFRLSRYVVALTWRLWRARGLRSTTPEGRERLLGGYGPTVILLLLLAWVALLITGYGLIIHALRHQLQPIPADLAESIYFAGVALMTIGYGEIVPVAWPARLVVIAAAATGLAVVALTATYLFSLYGSFQRRETLVVTLGARAGTPPSGVAL